MNETYHSILICSVLFHLIPHSFPFYSTIAHSIPDISIPFHYYFLGLVNRIHDYYKILLLTAWENAQQRRVRHEDPHGMPAVRLGCFRRSGWRSEDGIWIGAAPRWIL